MVQVARVGVFSVLAAIALSGCGGGSSVPSSGPGTPANIPYSFPSLQFTLTDGSKLFLLMSPYFGPITGEAQLVPPPGSPKSIELFDVSGQVNSDNTITVSLNEDVAGGSNVYTITGAYRGASFQLSPGTSQDVLQEPAQALTGTVMVSPWSGGAQTMKPFSSTVVVGAGSSTTTWRVNTETTMSGQSNAFNCAGLGNIYVCAFGGQNWAWFDAYVGDTKVATGTIAPPGNGTQATMATGGPAAFSTNGTIWTSATLKVFGGAPYLTVGQ